MAGASTTKAIKYSLVVVNVIIFLSGLIMLIGGSVVQGQINSQHLSRTISGYSTQSGSIVCIIFGIVILLMSLFGLYAAVKDQYRFLFVYSSFMSFIFIIQFVTGVTGLAVKNSSRFDELVENVLEGEFTNNPNETDKFDERDYYQKRFQCCGWLKFNDYTINGVLNVPKSCCKDESVCKTDDESGNNYYTSGCNIKLTSAFSKIIESACAILVTFSLFNLISIVLSILLGRSIKTGYHYS